MKKIVILFAAAFSVTAFASNENPILTKKSASGYVAPGYNTAVDCAVFQDKVTIRYTAGMGVAVFEKPITLAGGIHWMIREARGATLKTNITPADIGSVSYQAYFFNEYSMLEVVELGTKAGKIWAVENSSAGAFGLRNLLDNLCK